MGTHRNTLHLVSIGHVMRYPPEAISAFEATQKALTSELHHRVELELYYKKLWGHWIQLGSSKPCAGSAAEPGISIWICQGRVPAVFEWAEISCLVRKPDFSFAIPFAASDADLSQIAGNVLAEIRKMGVSKTKHPSVRTHTAANVSDPLEQLAG